MHLEAGGLRAEAAVGSLAGVVAAGTTQAAVANQTRFPPHAGRNAPPSLRNIGVAMGWLLGCVGGVADIFLLGLAGFEVTRG